MAVSKRATEKVAHLHPGLEIHKGLWGYYLHIRGIHKQTSHCYDKVADCIKAALNGERPTQEE
ncbi:MAG: hypothetical protein WC565_05895 [Parcubacteria group bacterium]